MEQPAELRLAPHLEAGERILWAGGPRRGFRLHLSDAFLIPFSLLWGGFAFFWEYLAISQGAPWFFVLWGIPFVLVGAYLIAGRFWWDTKRRSATYYAVTDRRVIIASGWRRAVVRSVNLRTLSDLSVIERGGGSGDVVLGAGHPMMSWFAGSGWPGMTSYQPPVLEGISQAADVYRIIRQAQKQTV
jgi:hypothetical protein